MSHSGDFRLDETTRNKLIELVKNCPILYNNCSDRTRELQEERQTCWEAIGEKLNLPAETCKDKFVNLKNNYYKNLRNDTVGPEMRRRCAFLDDQAPWNRQHEKAARITSRRATKRPRMDYNEDSDNVILVNTSTVSGSEATTHSNGAPETAAHFSGINSTTTSTPKGSQFTMPHANGDSSTNETYQNGHFAENKSASVVFGSEMDDLTSFFKNMEQTARKFNPRLQVKVKRMISDIIYDAEEQWLTSNQG